MGCCAERGVLLNLVLFIFGAMSGSFVVASVWRLRAEQLLAEADVTDPDYEKIVIGNGLAKKSATDDYSCCLHCGYRLKWFDLIPIFSWLFLGGKCRKCRQPIGLTEILTEFFLGIIFTVSYVFWPSKLGLVNLGQIALFAVWLMILILLAVLFIYDLRWLELPTSVLYAVIFFGLVFLTIKTIVVDGGQVDWLNIVSSIFILGGIYWLLSFFTKEKAVGSGDAFIGLVMALVLANWRSAILALFLANLFGALVALPGLIMRKTNFASRLPLGPFLIIAFLVVFWWSEAILKLLFNSMFMI